MVIERDSPWWRGSSAKDLEEYLAAATQGQVGVVVEPLCAQCGSAVFAVVVGDRSAERRCAGCGRRHAMLDSGGYDAVVSGATVSRPASAGSAQSADAGEAACPCGGEEFELAVGFTERVDGELGWVYVALRCTADGVLGLYADWKINSAPTRKLLDLV
jgi:hypothetical protein